MADGPEGADHVAHAHSVRPTQWTPRRRLKQRTWPGPGSAGSPPQTGVIPSVTRALLVLDQPDPSMRSGCKQEPSDAARSVTPITHPTTSTSKSYPLKPTGDSLRTA